MKKKILSVLLVLFAVLGLTACKTTRNKKIVIDGVLVPGSTVELEFWHCWGDQKEQSLTNSKGTGVIDTFQKMMKQVYDVDVKITATSQSNWDTIRENINQALQGGNEPNLAFGYCDHFANYIDANALLPLDKYIEHSEFGIDLNDFIPGFLAENNQFDGTYYSLPLVKSTEILFYNKSIMDLAYPDETVYTDVIPYSEALSWDELKTISATVLATSGLTTELQYFMGYDSRSNMFINFLREKNAPYTAINDDLEGQLTLDRTKTNALLAELRSWGNSTNKFLTIPAKLTSPSISKEQEYCTTFFQEGRVVACVGSTAGVSKNLPSATQSNKYRIEVAPVPQYHQTEGDGYQGSVVQQGPNVCIFNKGTNIEKLVSWLFVKYCTTQKLWDTKTNNWSTTKYANAYLGLESDYFPVTNSAINSAEYQAFLNYAKLYYQGTDPTIEDPETEEALCDEETLIRSKAAYVSLTYQKDYFKYDAAFCASNDCFDSAKIRTNAGDAIYSLFTKNKEINDIISEFLRLSSI